jgi:hypothetical protein
VWCTVYYSLVDMGRLAPGESVLIHSAAGAVGQAAIMLARHIGAEVYATVGSDAKAAMLVEKYGLARERIFSSRSSDFYPQLMRATGGKGVDVVLNSLSGERMRLSCQAVAPFGRFVEIGRKELMDDALMPMNFFLRNISFAYVDIAHVIDTRKPLAQRLLRDVVRLVAAGVVEPAAAITTMPISEIEAAFRLIQAGKHTGKIILTVDDGQLVKALPPSTPARRTLLWAVLAASASRSSSGSPTAAPRTFSSSRGPGPRTPPRVLLSPRWPAAASLSRPSAATSATRRASRPPSRAPSNSRSSPSAASCSRQWPSTTPCLRA